MEDNLVLWNCRFQDLFLFYFQANGMASIGQYVAGSVKGEAGDQGLFVKNHAY